MMGEGLVETEDVAGQGRGMVIDHRLPHRRPRAGAIGSGSDTYAGQIHELAGHGASADEAIFAITTDDVRAAADVFRSVYDATAVDGVTKLLADTSHLLREQPK